MNTYEHCSSVCHVPMVVENSRVKMRINISQMIIKFDPSSIHVGAFVPTAK